MPSIFDRQFAASGFPSLVSNFGEPVIYHFASGGHRSVNAIIERSPPAQYDAAGNVITPSFVIRLANSATTGVLSTEVNTGGDQVSLLLKVDDTVPTKRSVLVLQSQDSSVIVLALR